MAWRFFIAEFSDIEFIDGILSLVCFRYSASCVFFVKLIVDSFKMTAEIVFFFAWQLRNLTFFQFHQLFKKLLPLPLDLFHALHTKYAT